MDFADVEEESILTAIFKDAFPENWQSDPNFVQYLSELSSYGVEKLAQEPERLSEEKTEILEETQNLAFQNYTTFIQTAECSREIFQDFQIIERHVGDLLEKLPVFADRCSDVLQQAQEITASRRMNSLTLQRHTQLLEILELPQLMDTCVRNGYYDEALELAAHVKRLEKKHANIPIIASIVNEVRLSSQLMLNQLLQQLRSNVQLPACLRVIGYLRRMDVFTEVELRIKFLQARDSWFQHLLEAIPKEDAYTHITKTIEASRVNLFDIITQYRAIFSDEDPLLSTSKDDSLNEGALFHTWIVQKVSQFLSTLEADLTRGVGGRLDSILGQCMYFGLSFSRVGADFRSLLTPIFQRAALDGLLLALQQANKRFDDSMRSYSLVSSGTGVSGLPYNPSSQGGHLYPPTVLLEFHPLAAYCNDLLAALNDLRLCAPIALVTEVTQALQGSYELVNRIILAFHRAEETTFDAKERAKFEGFVSAYSTSLLPYMNKCLQALYPPTQLAQVLGVTVSEMNKMGCIGQVDLNEALKSIKHILPDIEPEPAVQVDEELPGGNVANITEKAIDTIVPGSEKERTDEPESGIKQDVAVIGSEELRTDDSPDIQSLVKDDILDSGVRESPEPETKAELNDMAANAVLSDITSEAEKKQTELEGIADIEEENNKEEKEHDENKVEVDKDDPVTDDHKKTSDRLTIPTVNFSLPSDTDEEETVDIDKLDTGDMNAAVDEDIGEIDIDRDLSAMAEDVLRAKKD
ncbi:conserved oligomeric Golgi complex subunit 8-like [Mya arenaria]|uniref:conserved oligomeric Golgi complex subunit 8-like n=1 Tax=Mya arenaria TaxID=6604 RepID=UPI0022E196A0|nr:conserved oligomeric Golgi complex subunit 8-like [Mya arenaria]